jgi:hypothetical protein
VPGGGFKMKDTIQALLKIAEQEQKRTAISSRKFKQIDREIILDPDKSFDKDWYENDRAYDII